LINEIKLNKVNLFLDSNVANAQSS
jgi:hypothetical protein